MDHARGSEGRSPGARTARVLLAAALLCLRAASARCALAPLYPPPGVWGGVLAVPVTALGALPSTPPALRGLGGLDLFADHRPLAPLAFELESGQGLTPEAFLALGAEEKDAALREAAVLASADVEKLAFRLVLDADRQLRAEGLGARAEIEQLGHTVARLRELAETYGPWLGGGKGVVAGRAKLATARYRGLRAAFLRRVLEGAGELAADRAEGEEEPAAAGQPPGLPAFEPGAAARKLYEKMKLARSGFRRHELVTLLTGYGFVAKTISRGPHEVFFLPERPRLRMPLPRKKDVKAYLVDQALALVERRLSLSLPPAVSATAVGR